MYRVRCFGCEPTKGVTVDAENKLVSPYWEDFSDEKQGIELFQKEDGGLESLVLKENGVNGNPTVYFNGKVALKGLEDKNYQSVFAVYSANLTTENNSESTVLSIQEKGVTDYGNREDLAFFQTYKIGSNPTPTGWFPMVLMLIGAHVRRRLLTKQQVFILALLLLGMSRAIW